MAKMGRLRFQLLLTFFGLTFEYRRLLFKQIHEIVYYGGGGYDWYTIYEMPIWLRNFTYSSIVEDKQKEANAYKNKKSSNSTQIDMANPDRSKIPNNKTSPPNYITRASKK
jgi:hypothetical protein